MRSRGRFAVVAALALLVLGVCVVQAPAAAGGRLVAFRSCADLLDYAKAKTSPFVGAYGLGGPIGVRVGTPGIAAPASPATGSAPQQGVDYSGTNVQEAGVDEPDIVKTNGITMFSVENGRLESVDIHKAQPRLLDSMKLDDGAWSHALLLSGSHLLVLSRGGYWLQPLPAAAATVIAPLPSTSTLTEVDVSDPSALKVVQTLTLDGAYVDARMIGSTVRVVSSSAMPIGIRFVSPAGGTAAAVADARAQNRAAVSASRASDWLPTYTLGHRPKRSLLNCRHVRRPAAFSGIGMLSVTTIDLAKGLAPINSTGVMTDGRIVYSSPKTLFVATERWGARPLAAAPTVAPATAATEIHAFDISDSEKTTYLGSGTVPGYLLNQWSLSEFKGVLRVVSTDTPAWWGNGPASESYVTTLTPRAGGLARIGQVGGIGRGDRVYAVRMIGDIGYVVTFRQIDPLYTVDLNDAAHPRVIGSLDLPGYSSYLHPISDDLLLGVGQTVGGNEPSGTQVSLFDVSDPAHVKRLQEAKLGQGWSSAESDHHAFLYWPDAKLVVIPFGQQAVAMHVSRTADISELGRIVHTAARSSELPTIDRSVVAGSRLFTVSWAGVAANGLATLASLGWTAFPAPEPVPAPGPVPMPLPGVVKP